MKQNLRLSLLSMVLFTACSTAFKTGQTPDDVYFSPGREAVEMRDDQTDKEQQESYRAYISSQDDQYLRMKIANRYRWSGIDNFDYWYDSRYDFGRYSPYYNLNPYTYANIGWNQGFGYNRRQPGIGGWGWSSPIYTVVHYGSSKYAPGGSTSGSYLSAYRNKRFNNYNYGFTDPKTGSFVPSSSNNSFGNLLKRVFTGSANNGSSYDRPSRSFNTNTPSSVTPATSSNAGGNSGGFKSTGSSTGTGRGGKG